MCSIPHSTFGGDCIRKMVRTIHLMYFMIYVVRINKNCLMKASLVVSTKITCSSAREIISTRREDILTFLVVHMNASMRKLNWIMMSNCPLEIIERIIPIATMEKWDMSRKHVGWKLMTDKRRLINWIGCGSYVIDDLVCRHIYFQCITFSSIACSHVEE